MKYRKEKKMYELIIWKTNNEAHLLPFDKKPQWDAIKKLLGVQMLEIQKGYNPDVSKRSFEMLCDEESKLRYGFKQNKRATVAWYEWQHRTGHRCIPGDFIAGDVAIIRRKDASIQNTKAA